MCHCHKVFARLPWDPVLHVTVITVRFRGPGLCVDVNATRNKRALTTRSGSNSARYGLPAAVAQRPSETEALLTNEMESVDFASLKGEDREMRKSEDATHFATDGPAPRR